MPMTTNVITSLFAMTLVSFQAMGGQADEKKDTTPAPFVGSQVAALVEGKKIPKDQQIDMKALLKREEERRKQQTELIQTLPSPGEADTTLATVAKSAGELARTSYKYSEINKVSAAVILAGVVFSVFVARNAFRTKQVH
jgi:hypothetical protein